MQRQSHENNSRKAMLTNENKTPHTATADAYVDGLAQMRARSLANKLITYEHNPDAREAHSPAKGIRIRRIVPWHSPVDTRCKDHNSAVQSLGKSGEYQR